MSIKPSSILIVSSLILSSFIAPVHGFWDDLLTDNNRIDELEVKISELEAKIIELENT